MRLLLIGILVVVAFNQTKDINNLKEEIKTFESKCTTVYQPVEQAL